MRGVRAYERTVHQLLSGIKYTIDFYQREYEWERRNVEELLDDLAEMFLSQHTADRERAEVEKYPRYFLGTIITSKQDSRNYIVDGQQRLTTLTLLLIHIKHLSKVVTGRVKDVTPLIFSESYGSDDFNIHVPNRMDCLKSLYENGEYEPTATDDISVGNLAQRFRDIKEIFPDELSGAALPYFVDWLTGNVDLAEIEAFTDDDAFTIFETMNDRGVSLGRVDMLKGFLLANIRHSRDKRNKAQEIWTSSIGSLRTVDAKADSDFFVAWLRGNYAETARTRSKAAPTSDFAAIKQFHRWVRDKRAHLNLDTTDDCFNFITRSIRASAEHYITMRKASTHYSSDLKEIYYISQLVSMHYMLALSPIKDTDGVDTALQKMRLVTVFLDIYMARRMVNQKRIGDSTLEERLFGFMKTIRNSDVSELRNALLQYLDRMDETFAGITASSSGRFRLTQKNRRHVAYLLARMTAWIEESSKVNTDFRSYASGHNQPFEIEHIWSSNYQDFKEEIESEADFQELRNCFGGLVLLPKSNNASLGALPYQEKLPHYIKENLLAASLHSQNYERNPGFRKFIENSNLPFQPHTEFKKADLLKRQDLYRQVCEQIWCLDRLNAI